MGLRAANGLQNTTNAPQIAAKVLEQARFYAENGRSMGDQGAVRSPSEAAEAAVTHPQIHRLIVHYRNVIAGHLHAGSQARQKVSILCRARALPNHRAIHRRQYRPKTMPGEQVQ